MKCLPMIFNREMVCALLDGRKTVTRRPVKPIPPEWCDQFGYTTFTPERHISGRGRYEDQGPAEKFIKQPVFKGDLIWVRETFATLEFSGEPQEFVSVHTCGDVRYKSSERDAIANEPDWEVRGYKWRPSIHMPRWANRLTLRVTDVRIERLKEIKRDDVTREGFNSWTDFAFTWSSIYLNQGLGWDENPYVWVIEFEVINKNIDKYLFGVNKCQ